MKLVLRLTPLDPLIARDGRPFGVNQGQRMRGLPWPLPSVVAGSFRTCLVKAGPNLDFSSDMPQRLLRIDVAGVFPVHAGELYLPAPNDAVVEQHECGAGIKAIHRVTPRPIAGGCDFPNDAPLQPVVLLDTQAKEDFKAAPAPQWWPLKQMARWLVGEPIIFDEAFLDGPRQELRDHVCLDPERGAAAAGMIFATSSLSANQLPRYGVNVLDTTLPFSRRFADVTLTMRVTLPAPGFERVSQLDVLHPLGGERRLVHWHHDGDAESWNCPAGVKHALLNATRVRMVLATPAIFDRGWKPGWLDEDTLTGQPYTGGPTLKLVGVSNDRWSAVSGWSLARINSKGELDPNGRSGPKAIRRMVPAGSVYFFEKLNGDSALLADRWLQSVSDDEQAQRDGFGLAIWGVW